MRAVAGCPTPSVVEPLDSAVAAVLHYVVSPGTRREATMKS